MRAPGLIERPKREELRYRVRVIERDLLAGEPLDTACDAAWTSCSWHYSADHHRPLPDFIDRMQRLVRPGGLFGAEFLMPLEQRHHETEHYTTPEDLSHHFPTGWRRLVALRTDPFTERAHVGNLRDHSHRMGLLLAARTEEKDA